MQNYKIFQYLQGYIEKMFNKINKFIFICARKLFFHIYLLTLHTNICNMKTKLFLILAFFALLVNACAGGQHGNGQPSGVQNKPGDSTFYGLCCDCNDSIIEVMPYDLSDPKTFDITHAWKNHEILGMPKTGDNVAIILSADSQYAEKVINIDLLKGKWCYLEVPTLRRPAAMTDKEFAMLEKHLNDSISDSLRQEMFKPVEYGIEIGDNHNVSFVGMRIKNAEETGLQLAEYRAPKMYKGWELFNGNLVLTPMAKNMHKDTVDFKILKQDSLIIFFDDGPQGYYRKKVEENADSIGKNDKFK